MKIVQQDLLHRKQFLKILWSEVQRGDFNSCGKWSSRVPPLMLWWSLAWFPYFYTDCPWPYCGISLNPKCHSALQWSNINNLIRKFSNFRTANSDIWSSFFIILHLKVARHYIFMILSIFHKNRHWQFLVIFNYNLAI